jgi:hypothetical protein
MRFAVYARNDHPVARSFATGLRAAGARVTHRSLPDYGDGCRESFDAVAVFGLRGKGARILAEYTAAGVPVVVVDYGYVDRVHGVNTWATGHWQVSLGGLNCIVSFDCPSDRFDALGVSIAPERVEPGPTILAAQLPGDAAHPFETEDQLRAWIATVPHDEVRWHPAMALVDHEPLDAALARAGCIVTWNSNIGHDALLAGVPVAAHGPAPYADVAMADRAAYFARVAYSQWTPTEMETGHCARFLLNHVLTGEPPAVARANPAQRDAGDSRRSPPSAKKVRQK